MRFLIASLLVLVSSVNAYAQDTMIVTYFGVLKDRVGIGRSFQPDTVLDATFKVDITGGAKVISNVSLVCNGVWRAVSDGNWALGITPLLDSMLLVNQPDGSLVNYSSNSFWFYVAQGNENRFPAGAPCQITVEYAGGTTLSATHVIPSVIPSPPPSNLPPQPPTNLPPVPPPAGEVLTIDLPRPDAIISGVFLLVATSRPGVDIAAIELIFNDKLIGRQAGPGIYTYWDSRALPNGTYTFRARAISPTGIISTSVPVTITVKN